MAILIGVGVYKAIGGHACRSANYAHAHRPGARSASKGTGLLIGAALAVVLHSFASGGAAVTGVEAISNGVPAFKKPEWKNARTTLVIMGSLLGVMFLGLSIMDSTDARRAVHQRHADGHLADRQARVRRRASSATSSTTACRRGTMLILVLAANTSFADFPRLASFHAGDNFMPRQLTKRGHRLVFSNGIIFLAGRRDRAAARHRRQGRPADPALRDRRVHVVHALAGRHGQAPHPREGSRAGAGACSSTASARSCRSSSTHHHRAHKFTDGAWVIIVFVPIMVFFLMRLAKQYKTEDEALAHDVPEGGRRAGAQAPRRDGVRRPARPRRRPRDAVRPRAAARRAAGGALRHRRPARRRARRRVARARPHEPRARADRLPRPAPDPVRGRDRRARADLGRVRGLRAAARAQVQRRVAPHPARPDRGVAVARDLAPAARQRDDRAVPLRRPRRRSRSRGRAAPTLVDRAVPNGNGATATERQRQRRTANGKAQEQRQGRSSTPRRSSARRARLRSARCAAART